MSESQKAVIPVCFNGYHLLNLVCKETQKCVDYIVSSQECFIFLIRNLNLFVINHGHDILVIVSVHTVRWIVALASSTEGILETRLPKGGGYHPSLALVQALIWFVFYFCTLKNLF